MVDGVGFGLWVELEVVVAVDDWCFEVVTEDGACLFVVDRLVWWWCRVSRCLLGELAEDFGLLG